MSQSQCELVLTHLKAGGSLTVAEALSRFGCYALSQRIGELKRAGHPIRSEMVKLNGKRVARYWYDWAGSQLWPVPTPLHAGQV